MKFVEFLKRHCFSVIALIILLIVLIAGIIVSKNLFFSNNGDVFGNRLDGIEENEITEKTLSEITDELNKIEQIVSIKNNIVGRRLDFILEVKSDVEIATAKEYADKILEYLSDDEKDFYDIQVMITNEDAENENYPIVGYKHKTRNGFTF